MDIEVKKYLMEQNIKPKYVGFNYLEKAIILSMKQPNLSVQELFTQSGSIPWGSAYHAVQYALKKNDPNTSVSDFIHTATSTIEIGGSDGL